MTPEDGDSGYEEEWQDDEELQEHNAHIQAYQTAANRIARDAGYGSATEIVRGNEDKVVSHTDYGYRKIATGEYVPNAYHANFGWKNTYYQHAETVVMIKG